MSFSTFLCKRQQLFCKHKTRSLKRVLLRDARVILIGFYKPCCGIGWFCFQCHSTNFSGHFDLESLLSTLIKTFIEFKNHEMIENTYIMKKLKRKLKKLSIRNSAVCNCHKVIDEFVYGSPLSGVVLSGDSPREVRTD